MYCIAKLFLEKVNYREVEVGDNRNLATSPFLHSGLRNDPFLYCEALSVSDLKVDRLDCIFILLHEPETEASVKRGAILCLQEEDGEMFKK